jgi:hypothetical protein
VLFSIRGFCSDITLEKSLDLFRKHYLSEADQQLKKTILERVNIEPAFRADLVSLLIKRLSFYEEDYKGDGDIRALRELNAVEVLPQLLQRWNKTNKKTYYLDWADPRVQLLVTIAQFIPEQERIKFLISTEEDEQEAPQVRFRAVIVLCASGNKEAIKHVLSVYEQMKKKYSRTTRISLEDQTRYAPKKQEWDSDADMMTDYTERGLLLDPSNKDTDGDGLLDGNDRNPLSAAHNQMSQAQQIAQFLFYLHVTYAEEPSSPFPFKVWIVQTIDNYDGKGLPSLFGGIELTGIEGIVLHMDKNHVEKYRRLHGYGTPIVSIHEMKGSKESEKEFHLSEYIAPEGATGWQIQLKCFDGVWLPVYWEMTWIS